MGGDQDSGEGLPGVWGPPWLACCVELRMCRVGWAKRRCSPKGDNLGKEGSNGSRPMMASGSGPALETKSGEGRP